MFSSRFLHLILITLFISSLSVKPVLAEKYALLIGVSHYPDPLNKNNKEKNKYWLEGPVNDVQLMWQVLRGKD